MLNTFRMGVYAWGVGVQTNMGLLSISAIFPPYLPNLPEILVGRACALTWLVSLQESTAVMWYAPDRNTSHLREHIT